jgi:gamma-glutamyltranspeptidase/glutathione hydrolase
MPSRKGDVHASDEGVAEAARSLVARGNAVDVLAGAILAAGGLYPSVLFGPAIVLIGGAGAGLLAVDGRTRQPGVGSPRPRGFRPADPVPAASRVGVPALPAALLAAVTTYGKLSVAAVMAPAIEAARSKSAPRAKLLEWFAQRGPSALADERVSRELIEAAGRLAGGLVSVRDLEEVRPVVVTARPEVLGGRRVVCSPWGAGSVRRPSERGLPASDVRVVVAFDRNGLYAVGCYAVPRDGVAVDAFDVVLPWTASPVLRGKPRVLPGEPRPAAAPILLGQTAGTVDLAVGIGATEDAEATLGSWIQSYTPQAALEREAPLPAGIVGVQRVGDREVTPLLDETPTPEAR